MLQLPLNAVSEVSNFLIGRLQRKPNWRREEVVEELEGALNDWVRKHNLVVAPVPSMPPLSDEARAWLLEALDHLEEQLPLPVDDARVAREYLRAAKAREAIEAIEAARRVASLPSVSVEDGQRCSCVSCLRSAIRRLWNGRRNSE